MNTQAESAAADQSAVQHGDRRRAVHAILREAAKPLGISEIADALDVHPNTVRFHLRVLIENKQAEQVDIPPTKAGRPRLLFRARRVMDPSGPRNYRLLAAVLVDSLAASPDSAAKAVEAGRAWGQRLTDRKTAGHAGAQPTQREEIAELLALLDELGFEPELRSAFQDQAIELRHCPFLELVDEEPNVVCSVHLGLMRGATHDPQSAVQVDGLVPFAEPDVCLVQLGPGGHAS